MGKILLLSILVISTTTVFATSSKTTAKTAEPYNPWKLVKNPTNSRAESIGDYSAGCLRGAQILPMNGIGYQVMRLNRARNFGHPALINYIQNFGITVKVRTGRDILIGDMGQPRGGPSFSGHASHQSGLDVDVWFLQPPQGKVYSEEERNVTVGSPQLVEPDFVKLKAAWSDEKISLLQMAAESDQVARIFVNPVIKKQICEVLTAQGQPTDWLNVIRPWYFHDDHFHVRLKCQVGDLNCKNQLPPPPGDGCSGKDLADWFTQERKDAEYAMRTQPAKDPIMPMMPPECTAVLTEN